MSTSLHVLASAVEERRPAMLRTGIGANGVEVPIRFVAADRAGGANGVWAEVSPGELPLFDELIAGQLPVHGSFTSGHHRLHFETTILQRRRVFRRGERLLLAWPAALRVAERRRAGRQLLGEQTVIIARLVLGEGLSEIPVQLRDLDSRGASFVLDPSHLPQTDGDALHFRLSFAGVDHRILAFARHRQLLPDGRLRLGVEFDAAESTALQSSPWFARALEDIRACGPQAVEHAA